MQQDLSRNDTSDAGSVREETLLPDVSDGDKAIQRDIAEVRNDLRRDNVQRALDRLSDLIEARGSAWDRNIRHASILLMQEYHRTLQWKISNQHPPEVISRVVGNISLRALELCDALTTGAEQIELSPAIEPDAPGPGNASLLFSNPVHKSYATPVAELENDSVVDAKGVSRIFMTSGFQLETLDLAVTPGQILAVVGMNGSGKSTLLDILRGEVAPDTGSVRYPLLSRSGRDWRNIRSQIGYVAQRSAPWRGSVSENLEYAAAVHGIRGDDNTEWINRLIARHGLALYRDRTWSELSAGFRMRFDLALARINRPKLLILDEPLGNLDLVSQQSFLFDLVQLARGGSNVAIVITSQHLFEVEAVADEIVLLAGGKRIVRKDPTETHFEIWWPKTVTIAEEQIRSALEPFGPLAIKAGTTSCLVSLTKRPTLSDIVAAASERGLALAYVRDVTSSALIAMHRIAAFDGHG